MGMMRRLGLLAIFMVIGLTVGCAGVMRTPDTASGQRLHDALRKELADHPELVLDVLRAHPEMVLDVVNQGVAVRRQREATERLNRELAHPFHPVIDPDRPIRGNPNAPITIVEYANFQCGYCAEAEDTIDALFERYPKTIRLILKHEPHTPVQRKEALLFEAIGRQNPAKAWVFARLAFAYRQEIADNPDRRLDRILRDLGMDPQRLLTAIKDPKLAARIQADMAEARRFGLNGTPMFLVNGVSIRGAQPIETFIKVIDKVRK